MSRGFRAPTLAAPLLGLALGLGLLAAPRSAWATDLVVRDGDVAAEAGTRGVSLAYGNAFLGPVAVVTLDAQPGPQGFAVRAGLRPTLARSETFELLGVVETGPAAYFLTAPGVGASSRAALQAAFTWGPVGFLAAPTADFLATAGDLPAARLRGYLALGLGLEAAPVSVMALVTPGYVWGGAGAGAFALDGALALRFTLGPSHEDDDD